MVRMTLLRIIRKNAVPMRHRRRWMVLLTSSLTVASLGLAGCGTPAAQSGGQGGSADQGVLTETLVLASFYPLVWLTEQVAGPDITVGSLTLPGAEPHDTELTPAQVAQLGRADLVVTLSGLQPAVDQAIATTKPSRVVDAAQIVFIDADPHFWLDPSQLALIAQPVAEHLSQVFPDSTTDFSERANQLMDDLYQLDREFAQGLTDLSGAAMVTTHAAFGYLAQRYGLTAISIAGIDPEQEPSPARLRQVRQEIEGLGIKAVFSESPGADKLATALANEIGAQAVRLNPLETKPDSGDYLTTMRANLETLRTNLVPPA